MKIGVIGNYGATNSGDDAILTAILKIVSGHQVTIFSAHPEAWESTSNTTSVALFPLGVRSFFKYKFKPSLEALKKVDVVILGGGGLFQDKRLYACFLWAWQLFWVRRLKKPLFIYATGVGPLETILGRWLTRISYRHANVITVRDLESAECLKRIGIKKDVRVVADPVFLNPKPEKADFRTKKLFMISLRPWLNKDPKIIHFFGEFLAYLKAEREAEFVFVCMQAEKESDLKIIKPLIRRVGGRIYLPKNFSELLEQVEKAEFAIGMRYHFMIASLLTHTPLIPLSYTTKTTSLFLGTPLEKQIIPIEKLSLTELKENFKALSIGYNNTIVYQKVLAKNLSERAEEGAEVLREFLKTFDPKNFQ